MNNEVKSLWTSKLRSGEYRQTRSCLKFGDSFCCLGVLTDLYLKAHNLKWGESIFQGYMLGLPTPVWEWAGLRGGTCFDPHVDVKEGLQTYERSLSELNDGGVSFGVIADLIEAQL